MTGSREIVACWPPRRAEGEVPDAALLVLIVLGKQEQLSLTELAEAAHVTLGSLSQTRVPAGARRYVARSRGTRDRRTVIFTLTGPGREAASQSRRHRRDWLNARIAELTPAERDAIAVVTPLLLRIADS